MFTIGKKTEVLEERTLDAEKSNSKTCNFQTKIQIGPIDFREVYNADPGKQ